MDEREAIFQDQRQNDQLDFKHEHNSFCPDDASVGCRFGAAALTPSQENCLPAGSHREASIYEKNNCN